MTVARRHVQPLRRAMLADLHPVAKAMGKRRLADGIDAWHDELRDIQLRLYGMVDGGEATEMLALLGCLLGAGAQMSLELHGTDARTRRLHGALRTVVGLCLQGYVWRAPLATALEAAVQEARDLLISNPVHGMRCMPAAQHLSHLIRQHAVTADAVVGAELYRAEPAQPTT